MGYLDTQDAHVGRCEVCGGYTWRSAWCAKCKKERHAFQVRANRRTRMERERLLRSLRQAGQDSNRKDT